MNNFNEALKTLVDAAFKEDVGSGDHSTLCCIPAGARGKAVLKIKQEGILAGVEVAEKIFKLKEPLAQFISYKRDGEEMKYGEAAFEVTAGIHTILQCERLVLNCIQRMSGIATLTRQYANKLKGYKTKLLDTRKTTPNFRLLEKEAVRIGGGMNHRFGLYDMIMLKDNHIDYSGSLAKAISRAHQYVLQYGPHLKIEVETRSLEDVRSVMEVGRGKVHRIMLDNFKLEEISSALSIINGLYETEASGGINLSTIQQFADTGVDYVSVGGLIHQAQSVDLSLKAVVL